jgi:LacI family transcriptional regulator
MPITRLRILDDQIRKPAKIISMKQGERMKKIALVEMEQWGYCRGILRGITRYARPRKPWVFKLIESQRAIEEALAWKCDGIIGFLGHKMPKSIFSYPGPVVNISATALPWPRVGIDDVAIGRMAATHFVERRFTNFVFCGFEWAWSREREQGFVAALREAGVRPRSRRNAGGFETWSIAGSGGLRKRVMSAPKPLALVAATDHIAWELLELCQSLDLSVPEDVALLGVDNDEFICTLAHPQLSSIQLPLERIGSEAAALLERLMAGRRVPEDPILLQPVGVVTRQSTDTVAVRDADVSRALQLMREKAGQPLKISHVLAHINISRRLLELKFHKLLGRSPLQELHAIQTARARELLVGSDLQITEIARVCGLTPRQFWSIFRNATGVSPAKYRERFGLKGTE